MSQLNWPDINPHNSQTALDHAASLDADFEALDVCVELSSSKHHRLPSSLQQDIIRAILKAFSDNNYPFEMSEADGNLIGGLLLKHITVEAAGRARDRIPLQQYHNLRQSYKQLVAKLIELFDATRVKEHGVSNIHEPSPELESFETMREIRDSASRQSEAVRPAALSNEDNAVDGAGPADLSQGPGRDATKAIIAIDRPKKNKKKGRKKKNRDGAKQAKRGDNSSATGVTGGTLEKMDYWPKGEELDVHENYIDSGVETDDHEGLMRMLINNEAQCESIRLQLQEYESWQLGDSALWHATDELMEDQDTVGKYVVGEDDSGVELVEGDILGVDPGDLTQRPNDQADSQTQFERTEQLQQGQGMMQEIAGPDRSSLITFNIKTQAAVNHLNDIGSDGILQRLTNSLEAMRSLGYNPPHSINFINAMLLDNGDVEVHAHARSEADMERLRRIPGWDLEFEKSISPPAESYAVKIPRISRDNLDMQNRKHKATVIREFLEENLRFVVSLRSVDDIRNIRWSKYYGKQSSLVIEFRTAQQADEVLSSGIFVRGKYYKCQSVDQMILRCGRCQAFGHHEYRCSCAHRCGRCSLQHPTSACLSHLILCANCNGPHEAKDATCPAREAHKQILRYNNSLSQVEREQRIRKQFQDHSAEMTIRLPSPNSLSTTMSTRPHNEGGIKAEQDESFQDIDHTGEYRGRAAALGHISMRTSPQCEPCVKAEDGYCIQEMDLTQSQPPSLTSIQRQLDDIRKDVDRISLPQQSHSMMKKRGADEMLMDG